MNSKLSGLWRLLAASLVTGGSIGLIGTAFRFLLSEAGRLRDSILVQAHQWSDFGVLVSVLGVAIAAGLARFLVVQFAPLAAGSGVQHVEAVARGEAAPAGLEIVPIKFLGGLLAIGSGLDLGREGPTVQMGAAIGTTWGRSLLPDVADRIGAFYNVLTCSLLQFADRLAAIPSVARAAGIGGAIGLVAWFRPGIVGDGDDLTQAVLSNHVAIGELALISVTRFLIGPLSYAAGTPGGLFAPLLVVGAAFGALFAGFGAAFMPDEFVAVNFAVVGMAALFTAIVRAPLTGITLAIEMTGRADLVLAMMTASIGVILVTSLCGSEPIYDSLRKRRLAEGSMRRPGVVQGAGASSRPRRGRDATLNRR